MSVIINWEKYNTIRESILNWEKKIEERADKLFIKAKKNRIENENKNIKIEKLFINWKVQFNNFQYV
jgi:hypothetical protein